MTWKVVAWAIELDGLSTHDKFVLVVLANHANKDDGTACYPSIARICRYTALSRDSVIRALKRLEAARLISVHREKRAGVNMPNSYRLNVGAVAASDYVVAHSDNPVVAASDCPVVAGSDYLSQPASEVVADSDTKLSLKPNPKEEQERPHPPATLTFDREAGEFNGLDDLARKRLTRAFQTVSVDTELTRAAAWLQANPERSTDNLPGFLHNWMTRAHERGLRVAAKAAAPTTTRAASVGERRDEWTDAMFGARRAERELDSTPL